MNARHLGIAHPLALVDAMGKPTALGPLRSMPVVQWKPMARQRVTDVLSPACKLEGLTPAERVPPPKPPVQMVHPQRPNPFHSFKVAREGLVYCP